MGFPVITKLDRVCMICVGQRTGLVYGIGDAIAFVCGNSSWWPQAPG